MAHTPSFRLVQLRDELTHYRVQARLTQQEAAAKLGCSQGRIHKIEAGLILTIKPHDLTAMFDAYEVPEEEREELRGLARTGISKRGTWSAPRAAPRWFRRYCSLEPRSRVFEAINVDRPHGLLQCADYIRLQFALSGGVNLDGQLAIRLARQLAIFEAESPPECTFVLGESVLHRTMGDRLVALAQLRHMMKLSELSFVTILVVPDDARISSLGHEFVLMQFDHDVSSDLAYVENEVRAEYLDGEKEVRAYRHRYSIVRSAALSEVDSRSLIQEKINQLEKSEV